MNIKNVFDKLDNALFEINNGISLIQDPLEINHLAGIGQGIMACKQVLLDEGFSPLEEDDFPERMILKFPSYTQTKG